MEQPQCNGGASVCILYGDLQNDTYVHKHKDHTSHDRRQRSGYALSLFSTRRSLASQIPYSNHHTQITHTSYHTRSTYGTARLARSSSLLQTKCKMRIPQSEVGTSHASSSMNQTTPVYAMSL